MNTPQRCGSVRPPPRGLGRPGIFLISFFWSPELRNHPEPRQFRPDPPGLKKISHWPQKGLRLTFSARIPLFLIAGVYAGWFFNYNFPPFVSQLWNWDVCSNSEIQLFFVFFVHWLFVFFIGWVITTGDSHGSQFCMCVLVCSFLIVKCLIIRPITRPIRCLSHSSGFRAFSGPVISPVVFPLCPNIQFFPDIVIRNFHFSCFIWVGLATSGNKKSREIINIAASRPQNECPARLRTCAKLMHWVRSLWVRARGRVLMIFVTCPTLAQTPRSVLRVATFDFGVSPFISSARASTEGGLGMSHATNRQKGCLHKGGGGWFSQIDCNYVWSSVLFFFHSHTAFSSFFHDAPSQRRVMAIHGPRLPQSADSDEHGVQGRRHRSGFSYPGESPNNQIFSLDSILFYFCFDFCQKDQNRFFWLQSKIF